MITEYLIMFMMLVMGSLFVGFLLGLFKPFNTDKYYRAMIVGYHNSNLRLIWKALLLGVEYIIGVTVIFIINSAFYPADLIRKSVKWVFIKNKESQKQKK